MNIYQRANSRLGAFSKIELESSDSEDEDHFGDAASYDKFLQRTNNETLDFGYMSDPSPNPKFKPEDFSTLSVSSTIFKPTI